MPLFYIIIFSYNDYDTQNGTISLSDFIVSLIIDKVYG